MYTDGIIFDMDGTIWDTCREVAESWTDVARKYVADIRISMENIRAGMGLTKEAFGRMVMPQVEDEALRLRIVREAAEFENAYLKSHGTTLYPQVIETMAALSTRYPLFIVSNCQNGYIETFLEMYDAGKYIRDFENPDRTGEAKAGNIRIICDRYGLAAPVYVGDTQGDLEACRAAGVPFIFAAYGFGSVDAGSYAARIERFGELTELFGHAGDGLQGCAEKHQY